MSISATNSENQETNQDFVQVTPQLLDSTKQAQARANIGALSKEDVSTLIQHVELNADKNLQLKFADGSVQVISLSELLLNRLQLKGVVDTYADLASIANPKPNDAYQVAADNLVYIYTMSGFQTEGKGFNISLDPSGKVEPGDFRAVNGNEVFEVVNNPAGKVLSGDNRPVSGNEVFEAVNSPEGKVISGDNRPVSGGEVYEGMKEDVSKLFTFKGFINKNTGEKTLNSGYETSIPLRIIDSDNLYVSGFSGATNNVALATFFDEDYNRLGYYNTSVQEQVHRHKIPPSDIPEGSVYVSTTKNPAQAYYISGVDLFFKMAASMKYIDEKVEKNNIQLSNDVFDRVISEKQQIIQESWDNIYSQNGYYHKTTGVFTPSNDYKSSIMLRLIDRDNLIVTGYSGATNNIALVTFFNENFNRLGIYNDLAPNKHVTNFKIPESSIPTDTAYIIVCKNKTQSNRISGVDLSFNLKNAREWVHSEIKNTEFIPKRNSVPNVVKGGEVKLLNYVGNFQNIHPKVLYFDTPLWGYKYWMAYTPYPNGNTLYENPCIAVSNDGVNWEDVPGINPLAPKPTTGYNSDTHLVWRYDTSTLECWYREYNTTIYTYSIKRRATTDGVTWTPAETIFDFDTSQPDLLSPAVIFEDGKYKMWYCRQTRVYYRETIGDDITQWTPQTMQVMNWAGHNLIAWHLDVIRTDLGLEFVVQAYKVGGNNNTSDLYYVLVTDTETIEPIKIISRGDDINDVDYSGIYRSSILKINDIYYVYYSGIANSTYRAIYLTKGRDITQLRGVNL